MEEEVIAPISMDVADSSTTPDFDGNGSVTGPLLLEIYGNWEPMDSETIVMPEGRVDRWVDHKYGRFKDREIL